MRVPLEITFRGVEKADFLEEIIRKKATSLERVCDHVISCRVAVEVPQQHQREGRAYRVRITLNIPPGHELVVRRESGEGSIRDELPSVIREAFDAARRKLKRVVEKQRGEVKAHPEESQNLGTIARLFHEKGYGFIQATDGRELYFHRNAVLQNEFDRLEPGIAVRFEEEDGEKGPQASTVRLIEKAKPPVQRPVAVGTVPLEGGD